MYFYQSQFICRVGILQVNLFQKLLFLHQLTHNMTTDVVFVLFWHSEQFWFTTCSADVASFWKKFTWTCTNTLKCLTQIWRRFSYFLEERKSKISKKRVKLEDRTRQPRKKWCWIGLIGRIGRNSKNLIWFQSHEFSLSSLLQIQGFSIDTLSHASLQRAGYWVSCRDLITKTWRLTFRSTSLMVLATWRLPVSYLGASPIKMRQIQAIGWMKNHPVIKQP
jgi:hypothetical protein